MLVTRIAPTPSGYLHLGNAVNFLLTAWLAGSAGGQLLLRIDDIDATRSRPEYIADIFDTIALLNLEIVGGPTDPLDFRTHHSQTLRLADYRAARDQLLGSGFPMYACPCSRRVLAELRRQDPNDPDAHGCRSGGVRFVAGQCVWRARTEPALGSWVQELGDFVLWRRDDLPAYQLTCVVDDQQLGVTDVVRGADLLASTAAQQWLAEGLGANKVRAARYRHHELVTDARGMKLSKSAGATSVRALARTRDGLKLIHDVAASVAREAGLPGPQ